MLITGGNHPNQCSISSECEDQGECPGLIGLAQRHIASLLIAVLVISADQQRLIEEYFFSLNLSHAVLDLTLSLIAGVPLEADNGVKVNHGCMLWTYTSCVNP